MKSRGQTIKFPQLGNVITTKLNSDEDNRNLAKLACLKSVETEHTDLHANINWLMLQIAGLNAIKSPSRDDIWNLGTAHYFLASKFTRHHDADFHLNTSEYCSSVIEQIKWAIFEITLSEFINDSKIREARDAYETEIFLHLIQHGNDPEIQQQIKDDPYLLALFAFFKKGTIAQRCKLKMGSDDYYRPFEQWEEVYLLQLLKGRDHSELDSARSKMLAEFASKIVFAESQPVSASIGDNIVKNEEPKFASANRNYSASKLFAPVKSGADNDAVTDSARAAPTHRH